jgi:hypothetical protein
LEPGQLARPNNFELHYVIALLIAI